MNLNAQVVVVLTPYGKQVLNKYYRDLHSTCQAMDKERFTLWELMQIFGPVLFHGNPQIPFEGNVFHFDNEDVQND